MIQLLNGDEVSESNDCYGAADEITSKKNFFVLDLTLVVNQKLIQDY